MRRAVEPPRPPDLMADLAALELTKLGPGSTYEDVAVSAAALPGRRARAVRFSGATLTDVDLSGSQLAELHLRDCVCTNSSLANVDARGASLTRTTLKAAG